MLGPRASREGGPGAAATSKARWGGAPGSREGYGSNRVASAPARRSGGRGAAGLREVSAGPSAASGRRRRRLRAAATFPPPYLRRGAALPRPRRRPLPVVRFLEPDPRLSEGSRLRGARSSNQAPPSADRAVGGMGPRAFPLNSGKAPIAEVGHVGPPHARSRTQEPSGRAEQQVWVRMAWEAVSARRSPCGPAWPRVASAPPPPEPPWPPRPVRGPVRAPRPHRPTPGAASSTLGTSSGRDTVSTNAA